MTLQDLLQAASEGDVEAWATIVDRFEGLVWSIARAHRLSSADAADVVQTSWLRLVENLDRIQDPERLGAWLATTARRECLRHIRLHGRELPVQDEHVFEAAVEEPVEQRIIVRERDTMLRESLTRLSERCQALLRLLSAPDPPSYEEISGALAMPIGAIGPTRARCLDKLRQIIEITEFELG